MALKSGEESEVVCGADERSSASYLICKGAQRRAAKEGKDWTGVDSSSLTSSPLLLSHLVFVLPRPPSSLNRTSSS